MSELPESLVFGALAPLLKDQGFSDSDGHFQTDADAISRLSVRGLMTTSESIRARDRLAKKILKANAPTDQRSE